MGGSDVAAGDSRHDIFPKRFDDIARQTFCRLLREALKPLLYE